jgi:hypothetical protein
MLIISPNVISSMVITRNGVVRTSIFEVNPTPMRINPKAIMRRAGKRRVTVVNGNSTSTTKAPLKESRIP